jgi:GxxExxY protein
LVEETVTLEIKAVSNLLPVHEMQLQTYLRMSRLSVGPTILMPRASSEDRLRRYVG